MERPTRNDGGRGDDQLCRTAETGEDYTKHCTLVVQYNTCTVVFLCFKVVFHTLLGSPYAVLSRGLCRMKMLPVMILANYHSSTRSAVSERPNLSARLVSQCPNSSARLVSQCPNSSARLVSQCPSSSARLVSQCPNSSARLVFPMFQVELATRFQMFQFEHE